MEKLRKGYFWVTVLLVLDLSLYFGWRISIVGYWSDRLLFWAWLLLTALVIAKGWRQRGIRICAGLLGLLLILSMVPMMVPFFAIILVGSGLELDYAKNIDRRIRIQQVGKSVMARPTLEVIEKKVIYEQQIGSMSIYDMEDGDSAYSMQDLETLRIIRRTTDSIQVELIFKPGKLVLWMKNE